MGNVIPDRFFWALPPGEEEEEGEPEPGVADDAPDDDTPPKNSRHVH